MKKLLFYLLPALLLCGIQTQAQDLLIGAQGSLSFPRLLAGNGNTNPTNMAYHSIMTPDAGIFAELEFSESFSLQPSLAFSTQGGMKEGMQALNTPVGLFSLFQDGKVPQYVYANYKKETHIDYLMMPVLAQWGMKLGKSPFHLNIGIGPYVALLLGAEQQSSGQSQYYCDAAGRNALTGNTLSFDKKEDLKESLHRSSFGMDGHVGISYAIGLHSIFVELGGNYGFSNIYKDAMLGKNNTSAGMIAIGYAYRAGKWRPAKKR